MAELIFYDSPSKKSIAEYFCDTNDIYHIYIYIYTSDRTKQSVCG